MSTTTLTYSGTLVKTTCWCSIGMALPSDLYREAQRTGMTCYCPLGHGWVTKDSENDQLKRDLQATRDRLASERARADQTEASLRATKGHVTRLRKEVLAGKCPFCGQHLRDLERHINRQHQDETPEEKETL